MNNLEIVSAYVLDNLKEIKGKKAFQKILYFLTQNNVPTGLTYRIYHYGPYSSDLDYLTDDLELKGAIATEKEENGQYTTWTIKSGHGTKDIVRKHHNELTPFKEEVDRILDILPKDGKTLELWSTTHFVINSRKKLGDDASKQKVVEDVIEIKGERFKEKEIEAAYEALLSKGLI